MAKFKVGDRVRLVVKSDPIYGVKLREIRTVVFACDRYIQLEDNARITDNTYWEWPPEWFDLAETFDEILATNDKNKLFRYLKDHLNA